jgi:hypothetical protein
MPEYVFEPGTFRKFKTLNKIHLGAVQKDIPERTMVEFDGTTVVFGADRYNLPGFIGALRSGWAVPIEDNISLYVNKPAGVQMHNATKPDQKMDQPMAVAATEDEMQVGTLAEANAKRTSGIDRMAQEAAAMQRAAKLRAQEATAFQRSAEDEFVEIDYRLKPATPQSSEAALKGAEEALADVAPRQVRGMKLVRDDIEEQDAVPIARLSSPAKQGPIEIGSIKAADEARKLNPLTGAPAPKMQKLAKAKTLGAASGDELADIMPDAAVAAPPAKKPVASDPVTWDKTGSVKERTDRAMALHGSNKAALEQVMSLETPQVKREIRLRMAMGK